MKTLKFCSVILLCLSFSTYGINSSIEKELNNELEAITKEHGIPALSVAVITAGKIIYAEGFGFQDEENNVPVTRNTLFRVASISKLFTAQAVMQLVEKKELSIDDKIFKYLPEFKVSNITVGQLLTHSSGLRDRVRPVSPEYKRSLSSYLKLVSSSLENDVLPGTFNYSDTGFNLLGAIVSAVSKLPFDDI